MTVSSTCQASDDGIIMRCDDGQLFSFFFLLKTHPWTPGVPHLTSRSQMGASSLFSHVPLLRPPGKIFLRSTFNFFLDLLLHDGE